MNYPSLLEMLKAGAHFGHRTTKWHPKMEPYIFGARNNVHIINLEITEQKLREALEYIRDLIAGGGVIVFVGTKPQARPLIKKYAEECAMPYISERWLGGTLTNFNQIRGRVRYYLDLKKKWETGELAKYTKKEQFEFAHEIEKLAQKYGGIANLEKRPDALFIIDVREESTAVREAKHTGVKMVAVCDTNINPDLIDYCIPGNDDAIKSIELFARLASEAVKEGRELAAIRQKEAQTKAVAETSAGQ